MISKKKVKHNLTKTYKYFFDIFLNSELKYYSKKLFQEYSKIDIKYVNAYVDDKTVTNKYWMNSEQDDKNYAYFYLTIDKKANNLKSFLKELNTSKHYVTHYVYSKDPNKFVVVFCTTDDFYIKAFERLMQSQYSKMFYNDNYKLGSSVTEPYQFIESIKHHLINYKPGEKYYKESYYILTKDREYFNVEILPIIGNNPTQEDIEIALAVEFDGKFDMVREII